MQLYFPTIAAQIDLVTGVGGVIAAVLLSFVLITLVASYYRFQNIVLQAENTNPEDMGAAAEEILRVQLARYLAGCARRGTSFSVALIRVPDLSYTMGIDTPVISSIKNAARRNDVSCVFDESTAVLLLESEPEDGITILSRILQSLENDLTETASGAIRVGMASYPGHGLSGKDLIQVAEEGLEQTSADEQIILPEIVDLDAEEEEEPAVDEDAGNEEQSDADQGEKEQSSSWKDRRKSSMLDELTGVLKPSAVSAYMQRTMSELRRKKESAALFCIGLNNMDHIARFHGEAAADDVMAGVSKVLQDNLRADDLIGRHEKFAYLVLAQCSLAEAEIIGKRITTLVQNSIFVSGNKKLRTTITLGVATHPEHGRNLHYLYLAGQKVLNHSRANDIRAYAVYDPEIHDKVPTKPMKSIKSIQN
ncbi:diguanylate cyclase [Pontiellaceae bacterium B12227]|nr:diguanylate cyclase [Pontiellaceae bacterium B12227]